MRAVKAHLGRMRDVRKLDAGGRAGRSESAESSTGAGFCAAGIGGATGDGFGGEVCSTSGRLVSDFLLLMTSTVI